MSIPSFDDTVIALFRLSGELELAATEQRGPDRFKDLTINTTLDSYGSEVLTVQNRQHSQQAAKTAKTASSLAAFQQAIMKYGTDAWRGAQSRSA